MALAPVISIPVDDSEFQKFQAAFGEYHEKLKGMPAEWQKTNDKIVELAQLQRRMGVSADTAWSNATKAASDYEKAVGRASSAGSDLGKGAGAAAKAFRQMAHDAKAVAAGMFHATRSLAKFATFGLGGGLLGLGGLTFGLDALAHSVLERQRTARGLGLTTGQLAAFSTFTSPFGGAGVLQAAAAAKMNLPAASGQLSQLGIPLSQARADTSAQLAAQIITATRRAYRANPSGFGQTTAFAAATHFGESPADIYNFGTASNSEFRKAMANAISPTNAAALGFTAKVAQSLTRIVFATPEF